MYFIIYLDNALSLYGCAIIGNVISSESIPLLESLHMSVCNVCEDGIKQILTAMKNHPLINLKDFNIAGNNIGDIGLKVVRETLTSENYNKLEILDVSCINFILFSKWFYC